MPPRENKNNNVLQHTYNIGFQRPHQLAAPVLGLDDTVDGGTGAGPAAGDLEVSPLQSILCARVLRTLQSVFNCYCGSPYLYY